MIIALLKLFVPIFVVVGPVGAVPLFLGMTARDTIERRRRTAWIAAATTTAVLIAAVFAGRAVFDFFDISLDAFRIAGGILLFLIALDFVQVRQARMKTSDSEYEEGLQKEEVGVIPLAIPMLSGPGAIATVLVLRGDAGEGFVAGLPLLLAIVLVGFATLGILLLAVRLQRHVTATALGILLRLEGLLLAAIAVQMTVTGVTHLVVSTARAVHS